MPASDSEGLLSKYGGDDADTSSEAGADIIGLPVDNNTDVAAFDGSHWMPSPGLCLRASGAN